MDKESTMGLLPPGTMPLTGSDPASIGGYDLLARLSEDEPPTAYLARPTSSQSLVVLKLARPRPAGGNRMRRNYLDVAGIRMPSAYVATVMGKGSHDGMVYLVREYVDGMTLKQLVEEDGRLDPVTLNAVAVATASALVAIHDASQTHGNLKPTNVMVTLAGVRLLDHGLARKSGQPRPQPADDMLAWARIVLFAGTGNGNGILNGGILDKPMGQLVRRAMSPEVEDRPSARETVLGLISPSTREGSGKTRVSRRVPFPVGRFSA